MFLIGMRDLPPAQVVTKGLTFAAEWLNGRLCQACGQLVILAIRLVVQEIEVVIVFLQRQQNTEPHLHSKTTLPVFAVSKSENASGASLMEKRWVIVSSRDN